MIGRVDTRLQCANLKSLMGTEGGGQAKKLKEGTAELSSRIAAHLGARRVHMHAAVREVDWSDGVTVAVTVEYADRTRAQFFAAQLVLAIPPALWCSIVWRPALQPAKAQLAQHMPMGSIIKTNMYYARPFWRERGFSGEAINMDPAGPVFCIDDTKVTRTYAVCLRPLTPSVPARRVIPLADGVCVGGRLPHRAVTHA